MFGFFKSRTRIAEELSRRNVMVLQRLIAEYEDAMATHGVSRTQRAAVRQTAVVHLREWLGESLPQEKPRKLVGLPPAAEQSRGSAAKGEPNAG